MPMSTRRAMPENKKTRFSDIPEKRAFRFGRMMMLWLVGETGFEPATPYTPCRCAAKLRHSPTGFIG